MRNKQQTIEVTNGEKERGPVESKERVRKPHMVANHFKSCVGHFPLYRFIPLIKAGC